MLALLVLAFVACADGNARSQGIAGVYQATEVRLTLKGEDIDLLAEGAELSIMLQATD